jgi:hypothetical protein
MSIHKLLPSPDHKDPQPKLTTKTFDFIETRNEDFKVSDQIKCDLHEFLQIKIKQSNELKIIIKEIIELNQTTRFNIRN